MQSSTFTYKDQDSVEIFVYKWSPDTQPKAVLQISHGMSEHATRYEEFARYMTAAGFVCYANDHRGHGKTAGDPKKLGVLGPRGWTGAVDALKGLTDQIKKENPSIPLFFFAHSLGTLFGHDFISQRGKDFHGVILCGYNGNQPYIVRKLGGILAKSQVKKIGAETPSTFVDKMTFQAYNKPFKPCPTKWEWLSRDHAEVEKYINDPLCGFIPTAGMGVELAYGVNRIAEKSLHQNVPKDLPLFLISGTGDTSNAHGKGAVLFANTYKALGNTDIHVKLYPEARHELLHEINRQEVFEDILNWIQAHMP